MPTLLRRYSHGVSHQAGKVLYYPFTLFCSFGSSFHLPSQSNPAFSICILFMEYFSPSGIFFKISWTTLFPFHLRSGLTLFVGSAKTWPQWEIPVPLLCTEYHLVKCFLGDLRDLSSTPQKFSVSSLSCRLLSYSISWNLLHFIRLILSPIPVQMSGYGSFWQFHCFWLNYQARGNQDQISVISDSGSPVLDHNMIVLKCYISRVMNLVTDCLSCPMEWSLHHPLVYICNMHFFCLL